MSLPTRSNLSALLQAAAHLVPERKAQGSTSTADSLEKLLEARLQTYLKAQGENENATADPRQWDTLADVELATAVEAMSIIERADEIIRSDDNILLGTRDLRTLRTLISLIFKWGTEPLLRSVCELWVANPKNGKGRIVEIDPKAEGHRLLSELMTRAMTLLFPNGLREAASRTPIATEIVERHTTELLQPSLLLGWLPKTMSTPALPVIDHLRPFAMRLFSTLPPALLITTLGHVLLKKEQFPPYVGRTASSFLTQQLLRPGGVLGLCESVFGKEEAFGEEVQLEKLESVSRTLVSVPAKMDPKEYYKVIVPRVVQLLSNDVPSSYRKIAAYTLSKVLVSSQDPSREPAVSVLYSTLHAPINTTRPLITQDTTCHEQPDPLKASVAFFRLSVLIANCDPSPEVITNLLAPIAASLYSLLFHLASQKTSDPRLKENVQGLLATWGKIVDCDAAVNTLWGIVLQGEPIRWKSGIEGSFYRIETPEVYNPSSILLPKDRKEVDEKLDISENIFDFYPDPVHFVSFLKSLDRSDIISELFIRLLEAYRDQRMEGQDNDPMKALHYLQIFMQMQMQLLNDTSSSILKKPDQLLSFIKQIMETSSRPGFGPKATPQRSVPDSVRMSEPQKEEEDSDGDSDDDDPDSEVIRPDGELLETTLNLLLAVMESREDLSVRTAPLLNDIFELLEPIAVSASSSLRPLAREARMVITARSASTSTTGQKPSSSEKESTQETYQKALKLLQDPILPVRAHGLLLLRELVTKDSQTVDSPFRPAILSIFLQSIQDDDSYIFLNGVQGLAAMVDRYGQEVLTSLLREYADGLDRNGTFMSEEELAIRVRVGEALGIVIRRCGTSLGIYRDMLVPVLFKIFPLRTIPVVLRTSSLSLLADAIDTYPLVMLPYTDDLSQAMIDLLQLESQVGSESVPAKSKSRKTTVTEEKDETAEDEKPAGDNDHLAINPKYPPLRRAALHLLGLLIRSTIRELDKVAPVIPFSAIFVKRARITLSYVASTDNDSVARAMAREIREEIAAFEYNL